MEISDQVLANYSHGSGQQRQERLKPTLPDAGDRKQKGLNGKKEEVPLFTVQGTYERRNGRKTISGLSGYMDQRCTVQNSSFSFLHTSSCTD